MLGQPLLEDLGQQRLGRDFVLTRRAGLQVSADVLLKPCGEPSPLVVEELGAHIVAIHVSSFLP
jgi:hypothetical protein